MSPAPALRHQSVSVRIMAAFLNALELTDCNAHCQVFNFIDIKITEDTVVQPDASVVCGRTPKVFLDFPPVIVVEILSPSTREKDRTVKFDLYEKFGVRYYMIVDVDTNKIEIYHLADGKNYSRQSPDNSNSFSFHLKDHCDISLSLDKIWE